MRQVRSWCAPRKVESTTKNLFAKGFLGLSPNLRRLKRIYRLMREDNLLCLRPRKFVVTTDSAHDLPYPNLARQMTLTLGGGYHYIRLLMEFVYLAVMTSECVLLVRPAMVSERTFRTQ